MEKIKSGIICVVKNIGKGHRNPFTKSANSTKKCSNDNLKSAQTTIFIKRCISIEKSFCNILGAEWHLFITFGEDKDNEFKFI